MTVSINRPNYLTKEQIAALSDTGNVIAAHTWDHHRVTKYTDDEHAINKTKGKTRRNHRKTCDVFCISFWFME
jgi:peptidoglycan/xylan/chitin deacetylase (PgdA/CDA1 family)